MRKTKNLGMVAMLTLSIVGGVACQSNQEKREQHTDSALPDTASRDLPVLSDRGRVDSNPTARGSANCYRPAHLASNVPAAVTVACGVSGTNVDLGEVEKQLKQGFTLSALPGRAAVTGSWKAVPNRKHEVQFVPNSALTEGDYLIEITPKPLMTPVTGTIFFHVGSLPRLAAIAFAPTSGNPADKPNRLTITFSEYIDTKTAYAGVVVREKGAATPLTLTPVQSTAKNGPAIGLIAPSNFNEKMAYEIEIPATIQTTSGVQLDTDYDGTPGGAAMTVSLRPEDYGLASGKSWTPPLPE